MENEKKEKGKEKIHERFARTIVYNKLKLNNAITYIYIFRFEFFSRLILR